MADHLPWEIVEEILSRLCVKSLLRFRCVCKLWCELTSDSGFIKKQCNQSKENGNMNTILNVNYKLRTYTCLGDHEGNLIQLGGSVHGKIVGSCNGILCTHDPDDGNPNITLFNPSTRQHKTNIYPHFDPDPDTLYDSWDSGCHGFGYDPTLDTYKIVTFNFNAHVYTFSTNQWRLTHTDVPYHVDRIETLGVYVNGALHWFANSTIHRPYKWVILAFDCVKEEFSEIEHPVPGRREWIDSYLTDFRGQLCDIFIRRGSHVDVWVKKGSSPSSWVKLLKFYTCSELPPSPYFSWYCILPVPGLDASATAAFLLKVQGYRHPYLVDQNGTRWLIPSYRLNVCTCLDTLTSPEALNWETTGYHASYLMPRPHEQSLTLSTSILYKCVPEEDMGADLSGECCDIHYDCSDYDEDESVLEYNPPSIPDW